MQGAKGKRKRSAGQPPTMKCHDGLARCYAANECQGSSLEACSVLPLNGGQFNTSVRRGSNRCAAARRKSWPNLWMPQRQNAKSIKYPITNQRNTTQPKSHGTSSKPKDTPQIPRAPKKANQGRTSTRLMVSAKARVQLLAVRPFHRPTQQSV